MKHKLILVGGGGHCQSVIDVVEAIPRYEIVGVLDRAHKVGQYVSDYEIIGTEEQMASLVHPEVHFLVTVGQIASSRIRYQLFQKVKQVGGRLATVVSPRAYVSSRATVGEGSVVMHDALINTHAQIGSNTIVNTRALVEHGVQVGNCCHIATGAIVNGDCQIRDHVFFGSQATVVQGVSIGEGIVVGAGATVVRSLTEPGTYAGHPARLI